MIVLDLDKLLHENREVNIALYGLGTETERFLNENCNKLSVVGLLDGFKSEGKLYGYPIISIEETPSKGVKLIIVIARPGSCKAIAKRVGNFCRDNAIDLFDVRGRNLLDDTEVYFDFKSINGLTRHDLMDKVRDADVVSFDLFDTLVMRKIKSYTDVFELLDYQLRNKGVYIIDFAKYRLFAEKELSNDKPPRLKQIYDCVLRSIGGSFIDSSELAQFEWELDFSLLTVRTAVREVFNKIIAMNKVVVVTTDSYYSQNQIAHILETFELAGYDDLIVSCEYETAKHQNLFDVLLEKYPGKNILHIGDDEFSDIEKANSHGIDTFKIHSALNLFDLLGGLGAEDEIVSISDSVKMGLFLSRIFNNPFWFEDEERRLSVKDAYDLGYLFCGPMISDFTFWMKECIESQEYEQLLLVARDGYLVGKLLRILNFTSKTYYFLSSRTAAIRAGMDSQEDIDYVDSMKFFGTPDEALRVRFGIEADDINNINRSEVILNKARKQKNNYNKYINKLGIGDENLALFDFVAKGTVQMYLQKLFKQHMKGFYFLQLEPEFMSDKGLDIEAFYSEEEKDKSSIYDNYYILETILTSPYPQLEEISDDGYPVFAKETRSKQDLSAFYHAQQGIIEYFEEYVRILPESARKVNKKLDEKLLAIMNKVQILDEEFMSLKVEDPFFGRITNVKDIVK